MWNPMNVVQCWAKAVLGWTKERREEKASARPAPQTPTNQEKEELKKAILKAQWGGRIHDLQNRAQSFDAGLWALGAGFFFATWSVIEGEWALLMVVPTLLWVIGGLLLGLVVPSLSLWTIKTLIGEAWPHRYVEEFKKQWMEGVLQGKDLTSVCERLREEGFIGAKVWHAMESLKIENMSVQELKVEDLESWAGLAKDSPKLGALEMESQPSVLVKMPQQTEAKEY